MLELIREYVETYGPSGREDKIREVIRQHVEPYVDEVRVDRLGNLIALKRATDKPAGERPLRVMLAAHMDEIGLIVTHIEKEGFLRVAQIGGVFPNVALGQRVVFENGITGVIGADKVDDPKELKLNKLYIDIGAANGDEAEERVRVGDSAVFLQPMSTMGKRVTAKALDDRVGCVILTRVAQQLSSTPHDVYYVFSAQEEDGAWAARTAAFALEPDLGIACDVTDTGDTPEAPKMAVKLGAGAAIKVKDSSAIMHPAVKDLLADTAEELGIPYQFEVLERGGTDAALIQVSREGVPSGCISIPTRYIHSPSEVVDLGDVQACIDLFTGVLGRPIGI